MINDKITVQQAADMLKASDNILLLCHKNPDGDTLGSAAGLMHALAKLGKVCAVRCNDAIPQKYDFLNLQLFSGQFEPDLIVAVDVADTKLLGDSLMEYADNIDLCIDHHPSNTGYAKNVCCDDKLPAAAQLMLQVVECLGAEIDVQTANCLYTGLMTDTGCFKYSATTAETHIAAAKLLSAGAEHNFIANRFFMSKSRKSVELEKYVLNSMEFYFDDRCAVITLLTELLQKLGAQPSDVDGIAAIPRSIEGVEVGVTIRQLGENMYKASLRTAESVNASEIAQGLGGGGHTRAAGCEVVGCIDSVKKAILREVETALCR